MNTSKQDKKLVIGFFTETYLPQINGVTENVETSAKFLRKLGHTVYIFAPKIKGYKDKDPFVFRLDSIRYLRNPELRFGHPNSVANFLKLTNKKFDIIHCHAGGSVSLLGFQIAGMSGIPLVFTYHTLFTEYTHYFLKGKIVTPAVIRRITKLFCNLSDVVIAPSLKIEKALVSYGVRKPILVIPGGIEIERFSKRQTGFLRAKLGISKEDKILLYVGRLGKEKNIQFLLDALPYILKKEKKVVLVLVGDGPEKKHLEKKAVSLGVKESLFFTGFIDPTNMPEVYRDADVFTFSSLTETQGLVVVEAAASGLPVVVVQDEAINGMIINGETGFLAKNNTVDFAEKVTIILQDKKLQSLFSKQSKLLMRERFSADLQVKELESIYSKLVFHYRLHPKLVKKIRKSVVSQIYILKNLLLKLPGAEQLLAKIPRIY